MLVCGLVLNVINWDEFASSSRYWVMATLSGPLVCLIGLWRVFIGQPWDDAANRPKRWPLIGDVVAIIVGLTISAFVLAHIYLI